MNGLRTGFKQSKFLKIEEKVQAANIRHRSAVVIFDPDLMSSFDGSLIEADYVFILPDNGRSVLGEKNIKGSFLVYYH